MKQLAVAFVLASVLASEASAQFVTQQVGPVIPLSQSAGFRLRGINVGTQRDLQVRQFVGTNTACDLGGGFGATNCGTLGIGHTQSAGGFTGTNGSAFFSVVLNTFRGTTTNTGNTTVGQIGGSNSAQPTAYNSLFLFAQGDAVSTSSFSVTNLQVCQGNICQALASILPGSGGGTANANYLTNFNFASAQSAVTLSGNLTWNGIDAGQSDRPVFQAIAGTVAVVPEPSTYALMGVGLTGLLVAARRRRSTTV